MATSSTRKAIEQAVETRMEGLVTTLCELVRIPTETPPGRNYDRIVDHLIPRFAAVGFDARRHDLPDDVFEARCRSHYPEMTGVRANLFADMPAIDAPGMLWYTHLDTSPAGDPSEWTHPPFEPVVKDGFVWGRGTADSKGGAAAILTAFEVLHELGITPAVRPVVALTTDEEIGPYTGLMHLADEGHFDDCEWFYSCDGFADMICCGALGGFTWRVTVKGQRVHSAHSFNGVNAIERAHGLMTELLALKQEVDGRRSAIPTFGLGGDGLEPLRPVLNVTLARGGVKHNVVPSEFVIEGDRRYLPEEDERVCVQELEAAVARAREHDPALDCRLEVRPFYESYARDRHDPWLRRICDTLSEIRGAPVEAVGLQGSTDVAHVANVTKMKVATNGLARLPETNNHGADERCRLSDLESLAKIVALGAAGALT